VALAEAVREGHREFDGLAVSTSEDDGQTPCGMCRQSLVEFCADDLPVYCDEGDAVAEYTLGDLLPATITREDLE